MRNWSLRQWCIVLVCFYAAFFSTGARQALALFLDPVAREIGVSQTTMSSMLAVSLLVYALTQFFGGGILDAVGPRKAMMAGSVVLGAATVGVAYTSSYWAMVALYAVAGGVGYGLLSSISTGALTGRWFERDRSLAFSLGLSGYSVGQFALMPLSMSLGLAYGWRVPFLGLGLLCAGLLWPLIVTLVRDDPPEVEARRVESGPKPEPLGMTFADSRRTVPYWLLATGYFVCGLTVVFVDFHLVGHAARMGFDPMTGAVALSLVGGMNVVGLVASGYVCDRLGLKLPLAGAYAIRAGALVLMTVASTPALLYASALLFGFSYLATVPPTSGYVTDLFGKRAYGSIYGSISFAHQVGGAIGGFVGGYFVDRFGSYVPAIVMAAGFSLYAALASAAIRPLRATTVIPASAAAGQ